MVYTLEIKRSHDQPIRIYVADDSPVSQKAVREMHGSHDGCQVVGEADDGNIALQQILAASPDVVLLKDELAGVDGVSLCQRVKRERPHVGVIMMLSNPARIWSALSAKADGYYYTNSGDAGLITAIHTVAGGSASVDKAVSEYLLKGDGYELLRLAARRRFEDTDFSKLSKREHEVLGLMSEGMSNESIAKHLGLSIQTVKVHVKHILKKLKVTDRTQAVIKVLKA